MNSAVIFSSGMNRIKRRFVDQLSDHRIRLDALCAQIEADSNVVEALTEARFRAHKLLGTASTLGFGDLGCVAATCEHEMDICLRDHEFGSMNTDPARQAIRQLVDEIKSAAEERH